MDVKIRFASYDDEAFWFTLDKELHIVEFNQKVRDNMAYIITVDGTPVGILRYGMLFDTNPICTLMFIDDKYRDIGYGRSLIDYWEHDMWSRGFKHIYVSTQVDENAQYFYRKMGYKDCGCIVFENENGENPMEMFMVKELNQL